MKQIMFSAMLLAISLSVTAVAEPVKIGLITTLSGPGSHLGEDVRDAFRLAIERGEGTLGGIPVELVVEDDGLRPQTGVQIAERMRERDGIGIMTGIIFSNVAMAVVPRLVRGGAFYISANAAPSQLAGSGCHPNYFNAAYQNDNLHEAMGQYVTDAGHSNAYILAPNYPAGHDALAGFKRFYQGEIVAEVYTQLNQNDYAAELAAIRAANPEAVFFFKPGGMGINFVRQYAQAGLKDRIPLYGPAFSFDERLLAAVGDAALGVINSAQWNWDLDVPGNAEFVAAFREAYGRTPTLYAAQGYDAAQLIGSGLAAVDGDISRADALRAALLAADFPSVRGEFRFGNNQHPIQHIYARQVVRAEDGGLTNQIVGQIFSDHVDAYAAECPM
jgi:branched-chain amino acid transport system substrate-binding protein